MYTCREHMCNTHRILQFICKITQMSEQWKYAKADHWKCEYIINDLYTYLDYRQDEYWNMIGY